MSSANQYSELDKIVIHVDNSIPATEMASVVDPKATSDQQPKTTAATTTATTQPTVTAYRRTSNSKLVTQPDGSVRVERRNSDVADIAIALKRRISASSLPSILPGMDNSTPAEPMLGAEQTLEKLGGKGAGGAYSEHLYPLEVLAAKLDTHLDLEDPNNSKGLTNAKASANLEQFGLNVLTPPPSLPGWLLFLLQFTNLLMVLLEVTATACLVIWIVDRSVMANLYIAVLLYIVIIATCYECYEQESKSAGLMDKFRSLIPQEASVIREGELKPISASHLTVGDVIRLKSGDKVPADCRVIVNQGMKADQSMITGENEPVEVQVIAADPHALEAKNIIFNGSLVVDGGCIAVVIRTGDNTLIGSMVELTGDTTSANSTLKADIEYFVKMLALFALIQSVLVFVVGCSKGIAPVTVFIQGFVTIMIGNVPQGLPTTVTACLMIVAKRMGVQNVFVKKLDVIETLGSCTLICTDKTGTLTLNLMSVANMWCFGNKLSSEQFQEATKQQQSVQLLTLMKIAALNSRVVLERKTEDSELKPNGDASELGFYRFFSQCVQEVTGQDIESFRSSHPKLHEVPFNSAFKWQMSIHNDKDNNKQVLFIKGAPDVLLLKCDKYLDMDGQVRQMDESFRNIYTSAYEDFGGQGERVLGFAMRTMERSLEEEMSLDPKYKDKLKDDLIGKPEKTSSPVKDLVFVGLVTLQDPPRREVPQAIEECHTAGVKVVMVTGDHPLTAASIARKIGLITFATRDVLAKERGVSLSEVPEDDVKAVVVHGTEIPSMSEDDWKVLVSKQEIVFARTSPEQKLTIVKEFTKAGNVTAMTGDGVNDSPALKQAAIGVAMGLNGSDVAKEAADIILLDDNFASIVVGIKEGRLLFANLKKSIAYTLAHLVPEVMPVLLWAFVGIPQPQGPLLALCIDLLTELVPATSFAYEEPESLIMEVPPRNVKTDKLTSFPLLFYAYAQAGMVLTGACLLVYFLTFGLYGVTPEQLFANNNTYFTGSSDQNNFYPKGSVSSQTGFNTNTQFFTSDEQNNILAVVQGSWFLMIVCGQASHVWVCRTCTVSIFEHGLLKNRVTNFGVVIAIGLGCLVTYTPGIQGIVGSSNPYSLFILYGSLLAAGIFWPFTELRKYITRNYPSHWSNKYFAW